MAFPIATRLRAASAAVALAASVFLIPTPAAAQQNLARIAILEVERVLADSTAGKAAGNQINELRKRYQNELQKAEENLRNEEADLVRQRATMSQEAFDEKRRSFERKVQDTRKLVQDRTGTIDGMMRDARDQIGRSALGVLEELMKERNFNVVLDRKQIVATDPALEITDEVIARVNKRLPSITIQAAKPAAAPQANPPKK